MTKDSIVGFLIGLGVGAGVGYLIAKRAKQQADDEIAEMREYIRERKKELDKDKPEEKPIDEGERHFRKVGPLYEQNRMKEEIAKHGYNYSDISSGKDGESEGKEKEHGMTIFDIDENEYDLDKDHDKISLTWYIAQHILADEDDNQITDVDGTVGGYENLKNFGKDDVKYIRNEDRKADYEIVIDDVNTWTDPNAEEPDYVEER